MVLAVATFSSVRSANRSARVAELSLMSGIRPVLIPSREDDPVERIQFGDAVVLTVKGHSATIDKQRDNVYMAMGVRNGGSGLAVIHGWRLHLFNFGDPQSRPDVDEFRPQLRDLYIPSGDSGFWQGAIRDRKDPAFETLMGAKRGEGRLALDLLYGDFEGGQRTIARFLVARDGEDEDLRAEVVRYWNVDRADPR